MRGFPTPRLGCGSEHGLLVPTVWLLLEGCRAAWQAPKPSSAVQGIESESLLTLRRQPQNWGMGFRQPASLQTRAGKLDSSNLGYLEPDSQPTRKFPWAMNALLRPDRNPNEPYISPPCYQVKPPMPPAPHRSGGPRNSREEASTPGLEVQEGVSWALSWASGLAGMQYLSMYLCMYVCMYVCIYVCMC